MHHQWYDDRRDWRAAGRGGPWSRPGGPGGHRGGRGFGGSAFRVGKMLADGDLRLIVLALLQEAPRHGYDIIKALEEKSSGIYSPSPGVVYPTLTYLEELGYAVATTDGNKKVYAITDAGRAHLEENRDVADMALSGIEAFGEKMAKARQWWSETSERFSGRGHDRDIPGVIDELNEARRDLKTAIASKRRAPEDEQRRVAGILRDAATSIRKGGSATDDVIDL